MALWVCEGCGTRFAVGAERCPQCSGESHHEETEEGQMPKISKHAGPSYEGILEPRHVTYDDVDASETEPREEASTDDELTGDGTGEALPPADEPVTLYESGLTAPESETPAVEPVEPKSTSRKQREL